MNATERLRQLLDERGVEWMPSVWSANDETFYKVGEVGYLATELSSGRMKVCIEGYLTPEQAVEATLGRGTCHIVKTWSDSDYDEDWRYRCSECGCHIPVNERDPETGDVISAANYCPNCGRRVES